MLLTRFLLVHAKFTLNSGKFSKVLAAFLPNSHKFTEVQQKFTKVQGKLAEILVNSPKFFIGRISLCSISIVLTNSSAVSRHSHGFGYVH